MSVEKLHDYSRRRIGFSPAPPVIRMEEEEDDGSAQGAILGDVRIPSQLPPEALGRWIEELMKERQLILSTINDGKLTKNDKLRLLEENRQLMVFMHGGSPYKFATEKVISYILAFSSFVIIVLACLSVFGNLATEVTTTFVGTVVGGTMVTIAQKLGKVGR